MYVDGGPSATGVGYGFQVDKDNVLQMQAALLNEGRDLRDFLRREQYNLKLVPLGGDPVSQQGTPAFNAKISGNPDSVYQRALEYAQKLIDAANALSETAKTYGHTEDEIKANLDRISSAV
jgi:hypothetical protein